MYLLRSYLLEIINIGIDKKIDKNIIKSILPPMDQLLIINNMTIFLFLFILGAKEGDLKKSLAGSSLTIYWIRSLERTLIVFLEMEAPTERYMYQTPTQENGLKGSTFFFNGNSIGLMGLIDSLTDEEVRQIENMDITVSGVKV